MKNDKLGQDQAFQMEQHDSISGQLYEIHHGVSKRLLIAKDIASGLLANPNINIGPNNAQFSFPDSNELFVSVVYSIVDELLKQENQ